MRAVEGVAIGGLALIARHTVRLVTLCPATTVGFDTCSLHDLWVEGPAVAMMLTAGAVAARRWRGRSTR